MQSAEVVISTFRVKAMIWGAFSEGALGKMNTWQMRVQLIWLHKFNKLIKVSSSFRGLNIHSIGVFFMTFFYNVMY